MNAKICGVGSYFPNTVVTNEILEKKFEIDPWILEELGIKKRFWSTDLDNYKLVESQSQMLKKAIEAALLDADMCKDEIDLLIVTSTVSDYSLPTLATLVQEELNIKKCNALEIHCGCVGALQGLDIANCYIKAGKAHKVVVAASNLMSTYWLRDWQNGDMETTTDQLNMAMFSDSASAVVIEASEDNGIIYSFAESIGNGIPKGIFLDFGGAVYPGNKADFEAKRYKWQQKPKLIKKYGSMLSKMAIEELAKQTQLKINDLKYIIFPQANPSLLAKDIGELGEKGFPTDIIKYNVNEVGNSATASLFHVLNDLKTEAGLKYGDKIAIIGGEASKWMYGGVLIEWKK